MASPQIQVSLSNQLVNDMLQNRLDLAVVAGDRNYPQGVMGWSEAVTWVASNAVPLALRQPLPLVLLPEPCWYRRSAIQVLDEARVQWMQACLSTTMTGIRATVIAGLGLSVMGESEVGEGLRIVGSELNLPGCRLPTSWSITAPGNLPKPLTHSPRKSARIYDSEGRVSGDPYQGPRAASNASAAFKTVASSNGLPTICTPVGTPIAERPHGTLTTGQMPSILN